MKASEIDKEVRRQDTGQLWLVSPGISVQLENV